MDQQDQHKPPQDKRESLQDTVRRLQDQYSTTGSLQASDLARVLGGPTGAIQVSLRSDDPAARWVIG